ncbi:MAG: glycosyltransferase [Eubacterium sp.]
MTDILLATYNGERFLREQLDSLFMQTYGDFKIIAHDDGSTDGTLEILKEYQEKFPGKLKIIEDNISYKSSCKNFLNLIKYSDAEYVMFCDQDDVWLEEKVRVSVEAISELENSDGQKLPAMVSSGRCFADENMNEIVVTRLSSLRTARERILLLFVQNYFMGCTMILIVSCALVKRRLII